MNLINHFLLRSTNQALSFFLPGSTANDCIRLLPAESRVVSVMGYLTRIGDVLALELTSQSIDANGACLDTLNFSTGRGIKPGISNIRGQCATMLQY